MNYESRRGVRARLLDFDQRALEYERATRSEARGIVAQWRTENAEAKLCQGLDEVGVQSAFIPHGWFLIYHY